MAMATNTVHAPSKQRRIQHNYQRNNNLQKLMKVGDSFVSTYINQLKISKHDGMLFFSQASMIKHHPTSVIRYITNGVADESEMVEGSFVISDDNLRSLNTYYPESMVIYSALRHHRFSLNNGYMDMREQYVNNMVDIWVHQYLKKLDIFKTIALVHRHIKSIDENYHTPQIHAQHTRYNYINKILVLILRRIRHYENDNIPFISILSMLSMGLIEKYVTVGIDQKPDSEILEFIQPELETCVDALDQLAFISDIMVNAWLDGGEPDASISTVGKYFFHQLQFTIILYYPELLVDLYTSHFKSLSRCIKPLLKIDKTLKYNGLGRFEKKNSDEWDYKTFLMRMNITYMRSLFYDPNDCYCSIVSKYLASDREVVFKGIERLINTIKLLS